MKAVSWEVASSPAKTHNFRVYFRVTDMALFVKMLRGTPKVRKKNCQRGEIEKLQEREESLIKKRLYLETEIKQELQTARTNCRKNRRVALHALRRKRWCEKQLKYIDCAIKAIKSAHENISFLSKVNDLIKDFDSEDAETVNMSDCLYASMSVELNFDEDELLAELKRLETNQDMSLVENDIKEKRVTRSEELSTAESDSGDEEVEDQLDYLRRWINDLSEKQSASTHT